MTVMEKFVFGITGGSGSGKTTVSKILSELGVYIIDTDRIAREVTGKDSRCVRELADSFGQEILNENGLERKKLAAIAFSTPENTALLNKITHKYIKEETQRRIDETRAQMIGIDGAVLIGSCIERLCCKIVLVTADRDTRLGRIMQRDCLTAAEAVSRLSAQPSDEFYEKHSDYIVCNNSCAEDLERQVRELYNKLKEVRLFE